MERLSGLDAGFLYMETPTLLMHTLKLAVLEAPGRRSDEELVAMVKAHVAENFDLLPPLRRRLVEVPFGLHHPVWIEDPDFDLDNHITQVRVPAPGERAQLDAVVGDLASHPLDRNQPLWRLVVLTGLAEGRLGVLVMIHHAVADGVAAASLLANVTTEGPTPRQRSPAPWTPEAVPTRRQLVRDAVRDRLGQLAGLPALCVETLRRLVALLGHRRRSTVRTPVPMASCPRTRFGGALTPHRSFATATVALDDLRRVRQATGASINDVLLAMVSGGLRSWLAARDELPRRPLVAGVPVSADAADAAPRLTGNRVSNLFTSLATDIDDPLGRLEVISRVTHEAKTVQELLGRDLMGRWVELTPGRPYAWVVRRWSRHRVADQLPAPINVIVSNVIGPREPVFAAGIPLEAMYSVGPILEGVGLNVTAWSYAGRLHVAVLGCREQIRRPAELTAAIVTALDELLGAVNEREAAER